MSSGAIFDFDGVLVDTVRLHEEGWQSIAREDGRPFGRELFERGIGLKNDVFIREVLQWTVNPDEIEHIIRRKEAHYWKQITSGDVHLIPGTMDLVTRLFNNNVPCAIGTSSKRENLALIFQRFPELPRFFMAYVTADDVKAGKPNPEVFLKAAQQLHVLAAACVVFEDAPLGIEAAKSGGIKAVALTTTFSREALFSAHPDMILDSLANLSLTEFHQLASKTPSI